MRPLVLRSLLLLLACFVTLAGCREARLSSSDQDLADVGPRQTPDVATLPDGATGEITEEDVPVIVPPETATCVLIPLIGGEPFVGVGSAIPMGVYQYDLTSGTIMGDQRVTFEVQEPALDVSLSSRSVRTDVDGLAQVRLNAGFNQGAVVVRAQSECSAPLDISVDILELPTGNLTVRFNYPFRDVYDVSPVRTRLYLADTITCRDVQIGFVPPFSESETDAPSVVDTTAFLGLRVDQAYTLVVVGIGSRGEVAAHGCADNVTVRETGTTEETVDLFLIPLNPAGDYDVLSNWDFRDAIAESGEVGRIIVDVLDIFEDPGRGLYTFLLDLIEVYVGGIISTVIDVFLDLTGLDDLIAGAINSVIESVPFLSDIVTIGRDLRAIIAELEVISELEIGKLSGDFQVFGADEWVGLSLYWRLGCDEDDPPDCGRLPIILDNVDLGLLRGDWTGRVLGYDRLDIGRHPLDFEYGRLILYVLEYLVLPAIVGDDGPITLEDVMSRVIGCESLGNSVIGDGNCICAFGACVCDTDVEGFCEDFISVAFGGIFRGFINALSFDAVLDIRGDVTLENLDENLLVDGLRDGNYVGSIFIGESPTPFSATWCGVNVDSTLDLVDYCLGGGAE
ncbi:MAG: hypothetical protein ACI81R_001534 [Bradymonadia bacterium]|jgi:hypothetical protein